MKWRGRFQKSAFKWGPLKILGFGLFMVALKRPYPLIHSRLICTIGIFSADA